MDHQAAINAAREKLLDIVQDQLSLITPQQKCEPFYQHLSAAYAELMKAGADAAEADDAAQAQQPQELPRFRHTPEGMKLDPQGCWIPAIDVEAALG